VQVSSQITVLIVEDSDSLRDKTRKLLVIRGYCVHEAANLKKAEHHLKTDKVDIILLDLSLPDGHGLDLLNQYSEEFKNRIIIMTGHGNIKSAVDAMRNGAFDFLEKPVDPEHLLVTIQKASEFNHLALNHKSLKAEISKNSAFDNIIHKSLTMQKLIHRAKKIAVSNNSVLINGETGTGKELFARAIHNYSARRKEKFIPVNCSSIPESLAESELFGFKKGAFTGASSDYPGKFVMANQGTIFLDEIGELPLAVQSKLLRVLETQEVNPLKGQTPEPINVRVICATNKNLEEEKQLKNFREDLYYRINTINLYIPSLKQRPEDIPPLARYFIKIANIVDNKNFSEIDEKAMNHFIDYPWPGNIRELKNTINEIVTMNDGSVITTSKLPSKLLTRKQINKSIYHKFTLKEIEKKHILRVLKLSDNNMKKAATILGVARSSLYRKMESLQIPRQK
jgi:DNA-binding NtrC family response regulator